MTLLSTPDRIRVRKMANNLMVATPDALTRKKLLTSQYWEAYSKSQIKLNVPLLVQAVCCYLVGGQYIELDIDCDTGKPCGFHILNLDDEIMSRYYSLR